MSLDLYLSRRIYTTVYDANITHNLYGMAKAVGLGCLWNPGKRKAKQLIPKLERGIKRLEVNGEKYDKFSAKNGWGTREQFIPWLKDLLSACKEHPTADIGVSK